MGNVDGLYFDPLDPSSMCLRNAASPTESLQHCVSFFDRMVQKRYFCDRIDKLSGKLAPRGLNYRSGGKFESHHKSC